MKRINILLTLTALFAVGIACSTLSGSSANNPSQNNGGNDEILVTPTPTLADPGGTAPTETTASVELPPLTFESLLETGIETGQWTEGEGLVLFLQYFVGETAENAIAQASDVEEEAATGIVRMAGDYLNQPENDPALAQEIERLLRMLFPPQEVLDSLSSPTSLNASHKLAASSPPAAAQSEAACMDFAGTGYEGNIDLGVTCYLYIEKELDGSTLRVYYPEWWQGDVEKETQINITMDALGDAGNTYSDFDNLTVKNVNLVFAILPDGRTNGAQYYFKTDTQACPITMFPQAIANYNTDQYKQIVAHEMFHCVQDWSFPNTSPYGAHKWWLEGTAHYYSNLVYPTANREWSSLEWWDYRSTSEPIFDMTYENFAFFQFMGNTYTASGLIDMLKEVSAAGDRAAQETTLGGMHNVDTNFNRFVVEYLSSGIPDSGGGVITKSPARVTGEKTISDKGEVEFTVQPFVAMRYYVDYEKEKRFLQSPVNPDDTKFSSVEYKLHQSFSAWSDLPPEVRSECNDKVRYLFALTTTKDSYTSYTANVTLAEKAECDPCLLGTWDVDPESFAAYMEAIMAKSPTPQSMDLTVGGHQYLQFVEDGKVLSQRADFTITINNQVSTIINGAGSGTYTADGEKMTVSNFLDVTESVALNYGNGQLVYQNSGDQASFSIFGEQYDTLGVDLNDGNTPTSTSAQYVCNQDTLTITLPEFGDLMFNRVDKILPTPVPTAAPPSNPEP
ncbi:hypothetical protein KQH61_05270 [bacterium]|nr:hypothetical protein [bacterium]MCB2179311.1 hypothetical protein [bacterium]